MHTMAVIGTGLIGTSVALAATGQGVSVYLSDRNRAAARTAAALGAGRAEDPPEPVDLAVLAVPPSRIAEVLIAAQARGLARAYTDVASVKAGPERAVLARAPEPSRYVGGHPLAGRERSGPLAARAELFRGRPWALTPHRLTSRAALDRGLELAELCGAAPVVMRGREHDEVVALTSHVPHLLASVMAARLRDGPAGVPLLAGQGLRDVTRIAAGDPRLWSDILRSNAAAMAGVVKELRADLARVAAALDVLAQEDVLAEEDVPAEEAAFAEDSGAGHDQGVRTLEDLLSRGVAGLAGLPRPGAGPPAAEAGLRILVPDRPGELARLVAAVAALGIAVDDVAVEAAEESGLRVRVPVPTADAERIGAKLGADGWERAPAESVPAG
ncbi:prephenate dehydrogenase [Streptomyces rhizosphaericus]|uniref:Prephenate dehydrogenase/arogenate dehydrogenase family protein n=1 Tax=Streptomyces rhizosphaericus TaxID=114699 RepID=A0A6G4AUW1_9ACTN|nr:prephenate dehydrogenase [Streptomyces rhizosphaericus]NEW77155.1 prephenate dehydrogenase/arogenate dehydrogenase family protein [Streptomyces rhizosphaericus]